MAALYQSRDLADSAVEKLRVYAQPQRLMILSCLLYGERTVSDIDAATAIGQPALSQQLAELRRAELVCTRRESKQIFYSLADETTALCVRAMEAILGGGGDPAAKLSEILRDSAPDSARLNRPSGAASFARIG